MEKLDQKVQEAVSKAMEGLDERVARAVERASERAVEKLAPKQGVTSEEGRKQPLAATGSLGGKYPPPLRGDERLSLTIENLRPASHPGE